MAKSLGNVVLLKDLTEKFAGEVVRLGLLSAHYRQPLDWTQRLLEDSQHKLDRLYGTLRDAGISGAAHDDPGAPPPSVVAALEEDLNTPQALTELTALARAANRATNDSERRSAAQSLRAGAWLLGLLGQDPVEWFSGATAGADEDLGPAEIDALVEQRLGLRAEKRFDEADKIRDELASRGIVIEDGPEGSRWRRARS